MADYDSDSSNEGENYTETNVLLGYATQDTSGDAVSHLGGVPVNITSYALEPIANCIL
jgi:pre-rRNA-processing protein TSR4